jgi:hypothetical protein
VNRIAPTRELTKCLGLLRKEMDSGPERVERIPELRQNISNLVRLKADPCLATGTNDIVITLEPTERFIELVSTLGAREGEPQISTEG